MGRLGAILGRLGAILGRLSAILGRLGAILASKNPPKIAPRSLQDPPKIDPNNDPTSKRFLAALESENNGKRRTREAQEEPGLAIEREARFSILNKALYSYLLGISPLTNLFSLLSLLRSALRALELHSSIFSCSFFRSRLRLFSLLPLLRFARFARLRESAERKQIKLNKSTPLT